jgi:hypothetical protein
LPHWPPSGLVEDDSPCSILTLFNPARSIMDPDQSQKDCSRNITRCIGAIDWWIWVSFGWVWCKTRWEWNNSYSNSNIVFTQGHGQKHNLRSPLENSSENSTGGAT